MCHLLASICLALIFYSHCIRCQKKPGNDLTYTGECAQVLCKNYAFDMRDLRSSGFWYLPGTSPPQIMGWFIFFNSVYSFFFTNNCMPFWYQALFQELRVDTSANKTDPLPGRAYVKRLYMRIPSSHKPNVHRPIKSTPNPVDLTLHSSKMESYHRQCYIFLIF